MQGIISAAMLMQLSVLGLRNTFDAVYGASAGAISGAYFVAGQNQGINVYTDNLCCGRFLDLTSLLPPSIRAWNMYLSKDQRTMTSGFANSTFNTAAASTAAAMLSDSGTTTAIATRPAMDLAYLLYHVMVHDNPLDWEAVITSSLPLKVVASSLDELRPITLDSFSSREDLAECLYASANVPEVAGPPRTVRGKRLVDAAVFEPIPVQSAVRDGCTHVLVLCARPASSAGGATPVARAAKKVLLAAVKRTVMSPDYMIDAWKTGSSDEDDDALYDSLPSVRNASFERFGAHVLPLFPETTGGAHPVCVDVPKLLAGKAEGVRVVNQEVGLPLGLYGHDLSTLGLSSQDMMKQNGAYYQGNASPEPSGVVGGGSCCYKQHSGL
jgi:predicted patatin/cPLA2 family phospholipase